MGFLKTMLTSIKPTESQSHLEDNHSGEKETSTHTLSAKNERPKRQGKLTKQEKNAFLYTKNTQKSIIDYLPWIEFNDEKKSILLEDGRSGLFLTLRPTALKQNRNHNCKRLVILSPTAFKIPLRSVTLIRG